MEARGVGLADSETVDFFSRNKSLERISWKLEDMEGFVAEFHVSRQSFH